MQNENDFLRARAQIVATVEKLESDLKYWRDELNAFDRVETTMRSLTGDGLAADQIAQNMPVESNDSARKRGDLKKRVSQIVLNSEKPVSSTEVERTILQSGYKPVGNNFDISVYQTLLRLAKQDVIAKKKSDRKVIFFRKEK
jgi:hypothetical protein